MDCIFCKIAEGKIPAKVIWQNDELLAFHDISPQAPTHALIIPKTHIANLGEATEDTETLLGRMLLAANRVASELGIEKTGYRLVINHGRDGMQTVPHLHIHLLGGRMLGWPPG